MMSRNQLEEHLDLDLIYITFISLIYNEYMSVQKIASTPLVKINNVSYRNGSEVILDDISFEIDRGDFLGHYWTKWRR